MCNSHSLPHNGQAGADRLTLTQQLSKAHSKSCTQCAGYDSVLASATKGPTCCVASHSPGKAPQANTRNAGAAMTAMSTRCMAGWSRAFDQTFLCPSSLTFVLVMPASPGPHPDCTLSVEAGMDMGSCRSYSPSKPCSQLLTGLPFACWADLKTNEVILNAQGPVKAPAQPRLSPEGL